MTAQLVLNSMFIEPIVLHGLEKDLTRLTELSPYGASVVCNLSAIGSEITGVLNISSNSITFSSEHIDTRVPAVLEKIFGDMNKKLTHWKRIRFHQVA